MTNESNTTDLVASHEAAEMLGVSLRTLYTYVSRGKIGRVTNSETRESYFNATEIRAFVTRRDRGKQPENVAKSSLDYGLPVLESRVSAVMNGRPWYRGRDAIAFSELATLEETAQLLWGVSDLPELHPGRLTALMVDERPLVQRFSQWLLTTGSDIKTHSFDTRHMQLGICHQILRAVTAMAGRSPNWSAKIHDVLATAWKQEGAARDLIRRALVLHADHELNTSCFAVRCVASTQASPYAALLAGCCAITGERHGNFQEAGELIAEVVAHRRIDKVIAARLTYSGKLPGFSHPLYPKGDPRASALLEDLRTLAPKSAMRPIDQLIAYVESEYGLKPKNDLAVAAMGHVLALPRDACQSIFVVGRTVGWCAHALEQYDSALMIRPRARFVE